MEKMTLEKLNQIRDQYKKSLNVRRGGEKNKLIIHMGTCGIASGARDVMDAVLEEMSKKDAPEVTIVQSSCIGLCDREPVVTVMWADESPVRYYRMTPERIHRIFKEHLMGGQVVKEFTQ